MGTIFRRMTMASLGLDSMDDVSQQSFDVIDRADTFAQRLLGNVDRMMPTTDFERIGVATSSDTLWNELYSGILTNDGPKNATDVGEWQYWLDAVLLTLFDEDEEEEIAKATQAAKSANAAKNQQIARAQIARQKEQIRERVAQLNAAGVKPSMLRQLSAAKQREITKSTNIAQKYAEFAQKIASSVNTSTTEASQFSSPVLGENSLQKRTNAEAMANHTASSVEVITDRAVSNVESTLLKASNAANNANVATNADARSASIQTSNVQAGLHEMISEFSAALIRASQESAPARFSAISMTSEQILASHVVERAKRIESASRVNAENLDAATSSKLISAWKENIERFSRASHTDGSDIIALHELQHLVGQMSEQGVISDTAAKQFKTSSRAFAARSLDNVLSKDFAGSLLLNHIENSIQSVADKQKDMLVSTRAIKGQNSIGLVADTADIVEKKLAASFENFSAVINAYVDRSDESASSMRWNRAAERFNQMHGVNDEQDRVLLRDLIESASQLEASGIVPKGTVSKYVQNAASAVSNNAMHADITHQVEMLQNLAADSNRVVNTMRAERTEKLGRQFNRMMSNVTTSINTLVSSLKQAGLSENAVEPLTRDITQLKLDDSMSLEEGVNRVEMLSHALDSFVERALTSLPEMGYDQIDTERSFVSTDEVKTSANVAANPSDALTASVKAASQSLQANLKSTSAAAQLQEVRKYVAQVQKLQQDAEKNFSAMLSEHAGSVNEAARTQILRAIESHNVEQMVTAQKAVAAQLNQTVNAQIEAAAQRMEQTRAKFDAVSKQVSQIERAADLANLLHASSDKFNAFDVLANTNKRLSSAISTNKAARIDSLKADHSIALGDVRIDKAYLPALNESITAYTKLRDEYARFDTPSLTGLKVEETAQRLERMTTLIQPAENAIASTQSNTLTPANSVNAGANTASLTSLYSADALDQQIGYEELVPEAMNKVARVDDRSYASVDAVNGISNMLGAKKALEMHANSVVKGQSADAVALRAALNEVMAEKASAAARSAVNAVQAPSAVSMMTVNEQGERLKVTMAQAATEGMKLRQPIGEAYQPAVLRGQNDTFVNPAIDVQKLDQRQSISGAEHFVPVMLGGLVANFASEKATMDNATASSDSFHAANIASVSNAAARFDEVKADSYEGERHLLNVSMAGTDIAMTPDAYVQAVAQPQISQAARTLSLGSDVLYDSFAAVLSQQGAGRSLNTLRRAFFEKLSQAGRTTARGWIGLNSQSFASLLGVESQDVANTAAYDAERGQLINNAAEKHDQDSAAFAQNIAAATATQSYADNADDAIHAFVASEAGKHAVSDAAVSPANAAYSMNMLHAAKLQANNAAASHSGELLGHIDSLLDYVEDVSTRNVGVFSTNDVVRVLIEQLPRESYLGERGLPKWRQKDTRTRQVEEARELREALQKIGATPVQGTQRFNDKKFVSPNLMPKADQAAAPLFSGEGSTPSNSASASGYSSSDLNQAGIPDSDIEILVDACIERFMETLNEELQRRRSE